MENPFDKISSYYDLLYEDKNNRAEVDYIISLINEFSTNSNSILELGSGTGRHAKILASLNYLVHGVERSLSMINATKLINGFTCKQGDITKIKLNKEFDVVLSIFHVASYLTENNQIKNFFINAYNHLKKDGLFIFDIWYTPAVLSIGPALRIKRFSNKSFSITRIAEPKNIVNKNIIEVNYTYLIKNKSTNNLIEIEEKHPMRHFSLPEIELICSDVGFKIIKTEEWLTKSKPSENTWGVCFVLKKT